MKFTDLKGTSSESSCAVETNAPVGVGNCNRSCNADPGRARPGLAESALSGRRHLGVQCSWCPWCLGGDDRGVGPTTGPPRHQEHQESKTPQSPVARTPRWRGVGRDGVHVADFAVADWGEVRNAGCGMRSAEWKRGWGFRIRGLGKCGMPAFAFARRSRPAAALGALAWTVFWAVCRVRRRQSAVVSATGRRVHHGLCHESSSEIVRRAIAVLPERA